MKTILVTGGAGFIGSHTCEALLARGDRVLCVDNLSELLYPASFKIKNLDVLKHKNFTFHKVDITDMIPLGAVFASNKIDAVIHLAALAGVRPSTEHPLLYNKVNIEGTMNLLELCRKYDIKNFVFASSSSVYGENSTVPFSEKDSCDRPSSQYAATKRCGELLCATYSHLYGIHCSCLRFFTVYGPRGRPDMAAWKFTEGILTKPPVTVFGDGSIKRDFTFVTDIVAGILAAMEKSPLYDVFNLGNEKPVSLNELIALIEKITGKKAQVQHKPGKPEDMPITFADTKKSKEVLGYQPKVSLEEGIRRFIDWYQKR
jgi:UDP-glucuronate 4-epimerase